MTRFSARVDEKLAFTRKVQFFGILSVVTLSLPLVILDTLIVYYLEWGSQLYITSIESGAITFAIALLNIFDNSCLCSRLSKFDEMELKRSLKMQSVV